jgi:four helix bundle protein
MAKSFRELVVWQLAFELEEKIAKLIAASPQAQKDFDYRGQLSDAARGVPSNIAENIAEGYGRYRPAEIARFLDIATGSLDETETRLRSGVASRYFNPEDVGPLIRLAARCRTGMVRWNAYLQRVRNDPRFLPKSRPRKRKRS